MATLAQTANNVRSTSNTQIQLVQFGEAAVAGNMLYLKSSDSRYYKADTSEATDSAYLATAMCLQEVGAGDYGPVAIGGKVDIGATVATADRIWLDTTAGAVTKTEADLTSGWYPCLIGFVDASGYTDLIFKSAGVAIP